MSYYISTNSNVTYTYSIGSVTVDISSTDLLNLTHKPLLLGTFDINGKFISVDKELDPTIEDIAKHLKLI